MPGCLQIAEQRQLSFPLLDTVLAKVPQPGLIRIANRFGGMRLRNTDQQDVFRFSPGTQRCARDSFLHARQILPNIRINGHRHPRKKSYHPARHPREPPYHSGQTFRPLRLFTTTATLSATGALPSPCNGDMTTRGLLIAIEGIDGSGKHTQAKLLEHSLRSLGHSVYSTGFPQYESWFGTMVGKFLNGDFGRLENIDPHFTALLYAGDRFEARQRLETALSSGKVVLIDRYIGSNLAHQV